MITTNSSAPILFGCLISCSFQSFSMLKEMPRPARNADDPLSIAVVKQKTHAEVEREIELQHKQMRNEFLERHPEMRMQVVLAAQDVDICSFCTDDLTSSDSLGFIHLPIVFDSKRHTMPCGHSFHPECINKVRTDTNAAARVCPNCRREVPRLMNAFQYCCQPHIVLAGIGITTAGATLYYHHKKNQEKQSQPAPQESPTDS